MNWSKSEITLAGGVGCVGVQAAHAVQLQIYFTLKYAMEILLSESSVVTGHYIGWDTSRIIVFLAVLGLTVLPVNSVVSTYISNMFEDRQILLASEVVLLAGVVLSFRLTGRYTAARAVRLAVCSALLTFVSVEVLEVMSTEAGTLARVAADGTITVVGCLLGEGLLLNATLLPSLFACLASIAATVYTYNSLFYERRLTGGGAERVSSPRIGRWSLSTGACVFVPEHCL
ncbi:hypothetical protein ACP4OV_024190 [Aristida adscensionis]